jgi:hypothetical protein
MSLARYLLRQLAVKGVGPGIEPGLSRPQRDILPLNQPTQYTIHFSI